MKLKKYCFSINNYKQSLEILNIYKNLNIIPILHFKYNLVNRFSSDWLIELINMLEKQHGTKKFKTYVDVKKNYGLFISLVENKIEYLNVEADKKTLIRLKQIARTNKVLINPNCSIVELNKIKNITLKIKKTINIWAQFEF